MARHALDSIGPNRLRSVRFEILTAVVMKRSAS
jgi:hypothetical protein